MSEQTKNSTSVNQLINIAFLVLAILSLSYTDYAVYENDHKECYINYLWGLIGTYSFILGAFMIMCCRTTANLGNESIMQQNLGLSMIVMVLSLLNVYIFMCIVWANDKHSLMFYPEFREWSIHLEPGVKHVIFYRIAECLVKIHSVILMLLLLISPFIVCCIAMGYKKKNGNNLPLAESMASSRTSSLL